MAIAVTQSSKDHIEENLQKANYLLRAIIGLLSFLSFLIICRVIVIVIVAVHKNEEKDLNTENTTILTTDVSTSTSLISRSEWLAQPPLQTPNVLSLPVPYVVVLDTATDSCFHECVFNVRRIQTSHTIIRGWWDIGYNFLVGGDGKVYEGRGWKAEGAHTYGYNAKSLGIAFIGSFHTDKPPERQILAFKELVKQGIELGYVSVDYKLLTQRQLRMTENPGAVLYEEVKTWDHWASGL